MRSPGATSSRSLRCTSEKSLSTGRISLPDQSVAVILSRLASGPTRSTTLSRKDLRRIGSRNVAEKPSGTRTMLTLSARNSTSSGLAASSNQAAGTGCVSPSDGSQQSSHASAAPYCTLKTSRRWHLGVISQVTMRLATVAP